MSDDESPSPSCSYSKSPPQVESREYHNLLEQNRRDVLKDSFDNLKNAIPTFRRRKNAKPSRAKILKRCILFIRRSQIRKPDKEVEELRANIKLLKEQYKQLEELKKSKDLDALQTLLKTISENKFKEHELETTDSEDSGEEMENNSGEEMENNSGEEMENDSDEEMENDQEELTDCEEDFDEDKENDPEAADIDERRREQ